MARGHQRRSDGPNTWPHRPALQKLKNTLAHGEPSTQGREPLSARPQEADLPPWARQREFTDGRNRTSARIGDAAETLELAGGASVKLLSQTPPRPEDAGHLAAFLDGLGGPVPRSVCAVRLTPGTAGTWTAVEVAPALAPHGRALAQRSPACFR
jgi:hypothetical protein